VARILNDVSSISGGQCEIAAFSDDPSRVSAEFGNFAVGLDQAVRDFPPSHWQAIGCSGDPVSRDRLYRRFRETGYAFATACHPNATVLTDNIGPGCVVFPGARLAVGVRLAEDVLVNFNATIGHYTALGAHTNVNPGVQLGGGICSGERVVFGIGSSVLPRKKVGDDAVISAGSAVWRDVPARCTMVGVPAVVRRGRPPTA
jgi:sugar O-acyltransferase (sialic acid O-acetyltransferase NeuD family)